MIMLIAAAIVLAFILAARRERRLERERRELIMTLTRS
jgi:hypothetical protein